MKRICFINGSLRGSAATSKTFLNDISRKIEGPDFAKDFIAVRARAGGGYPQDTLRKIAQADAVVIAFPLFNYSLPGALMRLLEDYYEFIKKRSSYNKNAGFYAVVNSGFPVPEVNIEAARVMKNFCRRLGLHWRFAVCVGGGLAVALTKKVPFLDLKLKKAFSLIAADIIRGGREKEKDILIKPVIPKAIMLAIKNMVEKKSRDHYKKQPVCS